MDITAVIINFQTPDLTETAVHSFKSFYPNIPLIIADNGSHDRSPELIEQWAEELPQTRALLFEENLYHGPAMDHILRNEIQTAFAFMLDSDTETRKGGFLEQMAELVEPDQVYGAGRIQTVNKRGFKSEEGWQILLTPYMLIKTKIYRNFRPFVHHGQPTLFNYLDAYEAGYELRDFPIHKYIDHKWRGTADRFGYGLNWRAKLDYLLNKVGL